MRKSAVILSALALIGIGVTMATGKQLVPGGVPVIQGNQPVPAAQPGVGVGVPAGQGQPAAGQVNPDDAAVRKAVATYAEALTKADMAAISGAWAPDGEFADENGNVYRGRAAITKLFSDGLANAKGSKFAFTIDSLRFPIPGAALVDAHMNTTLPNGTTDIGRVSAVMVKGGDGRWYLTSARDLPDDMPSSETSAKAIEGISWLLGEWATEGDKPMTMHARTVLDKKFLLVDYVIPQADGTSVTVAQMIGYDPLTEQMASWTFDSKGGNGTAVWARQGNIWTGETEGVLADGRTGSGVLRLKYIDENTFIFESLDREVDGQPIADSSVKYVRKAKAK